MTGQEKRYELGYRAKVLLDLHLENPKEFNAEFVLNKLFELYEKFELDKEKAVS